MRWRTLILIIGLLWSCALVFGQQIPADSSKIDSVQMAQVSLLQLQEQHLLDSLVKKSLQKELNETSASDENRRKEIQKRLKQIDVADSLRQIEAIRRINELKQYSTGYPVAPFGDTLFKVYAWIGPYSAQERADGITQRIERLAADDLLEIDSLKLIKNINSFDILYKRDLPIASVTNLDALWLNTSSQQLSGIYLQKIKSAIQIEQQRNSNASWVKRISLVGLILIGLIVVIFLINKLFRFLTKVVSVKSGISVGSVKLVSTLQYKKLVTRTLNILKVGLILLTFFFSLTLLFTVFPDTKNITRTLLGWIIDPAKSIVSGIIRFLPNLFTILIVYFFTHYIIKAIKYFTNEIHEERIHIPGFYSDYAKPTFNIVRFLLYAFMFVIIFPYLPGSSSPAFQGISVFLGILLSLGSSSAINNLIAGLVITYMRPFKIGDRIQIGNVVGDVIEKTMLMIRIRTIKNEDVTVPNSTVLSNNTINFSAQVKQQGLIIHTTVTIGYDVPWKKMHDALIKAALRTDGILKEPVPFVLQTALNDFFVSYELNAYTSDAQNQHITYSTLHQNIQDCCSEVDIEIMSPHFTSIRDGNTTTIPQNYRAENYKSPVFHFKQEKENENKHNGLAAEPLKDDSLRTSKTQEENT